jgi:hypothetical protein
MSPYTIPIAVSARSQGLAFFSVVMGLTAGAAGVPVIVATNARDRESMLSLARDSALPVSVTRYSRLKLAIRADRCVSSLTGRSGRSPRRRATSKRSSRIAWKTSCLLSIKSRKARIEQMLSAAPPENGHQSVHAVRSALCQSRNFAMQKNSEPFRVRPP